MSTTRGSYFKGDKLEQMVYKLLADSYVFVNLEHDRKMAEISNYTMVPTPGLVVKSFGILPPQRLEFQSLKRTAKPRERSEKNMNLKKVLLELSVSDVQQILAIDLDGDQEKALAFIRENLAKQVKKALQPH